MIKSLESKNVYEVANFLLLQDIKRKINCQGGFDHWSYRYDQFRYK